MVMKPLFRIPSSLYIKTVHYRKLFKKLGNYHLFDPVMSQNVSGLPKANMYIPRVHCLVINGHFDRVTNDQFDMSPEKLLLKTFNVRLKLK